jgi:hypothetical protein
MRTVPTWVKFVGRINGAQQLQQLAKPVAVAVTAAAGLPPSALALACGEAPATTFPIPRAAPVCHSCAAPDPPDPHSREHPQSTWLSPLSLAPLHASAG